MPIRPDQIDLYPADWPAVRQRILTRANNKCEGSPKYPACRVPNGWFRDNRTGKEFSDRMPDHDWFGLNWPELTRIVLTVAHFDQDPTNSADENLRAWCQRCHLANDLEQHKQTRIRTRYEARNTGQLFD